MRRQSPLNSGHSQAHASPGNLRLLSFLWETPGQLSSSSSFLLGEEASFQHNHQEEQPSEQKAAPPPTWLTELILERTRGLGEAAAF